MELGRDSARVNDAGTKVITVPAEYRATVPDLVARLEPLSIAIDSTVRVVINERTGTCRPWRRRQNRRRRGGARQSLCSHRDAIQRLATRTFSAGQTAVTPQTQVNVEQKTRQLVALEEGTTLSDVVRALNTLGVTPRDIIAIMQALKVAGALRAEVVVL